MLKTSLFFAGDCSTAYDCSGKLVFRVDLYGPDNGDADGRCVLTVRRKRPSSQQRWEGFACERTGQKPLFSARRSSIIGRSSVTVEVYADPGDEYLVDGSFARRKCTVVDSMKEAVAEVRRKVDGCANAQLGKDVFLLSVKSGFDVAFAMGLVLVLDQIHGDDDDWSRTDGDAIDQPYNLSTC